MTERTELDQLYVHESVENVIPRDAFVDAFDEVSIPAELVGDGREYDASDAVATYAPRPEFLDAGWVHCIRAGYDEFDTDAYDAAGVALTNSSGIHGSTVGELALTFMLSLARLGHRYRDHQNERNWWEPPYDRPFTIENERVCVVGLGTIGEAIATRCDALGMDVVGVRRSDEPVPGVSELFDPDRLHDAIENARFVVLTVPHTPETEGLLSDEEFAAMRDDASVINVARGPVVDEEALVAAIRNDRIAGAGLDVFETEPLPDDSPLWDLDEVIISPHKGSATNRYHLDIADLVVENVRRYQSGDILKNRVA
ncbi:D-2-hydroxyacid dehydrogenase [Natrialba asiatica]|uniref:2-D-hydroxyacid dehydrogenase n=1 Tax=Natrialba asiatica (strain ATCC 700177 / DSM 12278 / JCM 9576 / FERM P-10747 / NBRC 102637 / 172P1) TaxID=29540 RepID=M0B5Y6_NATA1|nr:D-2-hydroxyacid dehydrogenase [Natrialba asiatica]ELZ05932.1 2-D-hydroxyacid dehydrogenase [Natrialba asiatica DSM 12278]